VEPVFETMLVDAGRIRLRDRHLARATAAGADAAALSAAMDALCRHPAAAPVVVRLELTEAGVRAVPRPPKARRPVRLVPVPVYDPADRRRERKLLDRTWAASAEAGLRDDEEALLVSDDGLVGETTRANVFAVIDGVVVTPPVHGILPGVTRAWAIAEMHAVERELPLAALRRATTVFLTTAGRGIVPVADTDRTPADALADRWSAL
jgi:branched-subunit amino acid aminotransferase/4-amino-4-deoxychorismate lyase